MPVTAPATARMAIASPRAIRPSDAPTALKRLRALLDDKQPAGQEFTDLVRQAIDIYLRDVIEITMSEETWLWYGWGLYRKDDFKGARAAWDKALSIHPGYGDAEYAIKFMNGQ